MATQLASATDLAAKANTPFPGASPQYNTAREALLAEEIELRRPMTRLVKQRRGLPPGPVFWPSEMTKEMTDPGPDRRDAPDIASLWSRPGTLARPGPSGHP